MPAQISVLELRSVRGTGGGPEKTILIGARQRNRERFAVTVCYIRDIRDDVFGIDDRARRMDVDYVEVRERHSFDPTIWSTLKTLLRDRRIDIIHAHEYKTDALALLLARRTGVLAMATAHGWTGHSARERALYYPIDKRLLARFARVVAVSSEIKAQLVRRGAHADRVTVILNAIDPELFRRSPEGRQRCRTACHWRSEHFVIGAVGRLEPQKRFDLLLEAVAPLLRQRPTLRLAIAGDGSQRRELAVRAEGLRIAGQCDFLGHRSDVRDLYSAFDLFVQSSEYEGTPNAVLEAMATEVPIVATDAGGTGEIARPDVDAVIVPIKDVPALRAAVESVLANPGRAQGRVASARHRVETELSFATRTHRLERIYEELVQERRPSSAPAPIPSGAPHA